MKAVVVIVAIVLAFPWIVVLFCRYIGWVYDAVMK